MNRSFLGIVVAMILASGAFAQSSDKQSRSVLSRTGVIERKIGGANEATFDLGELPPGEHGVLRLTLENPFEDDFSFQTIQGGCSCLKIRAFGNTVPARGTLEVEAELATPTRVKDLFQRIGFFLKRNDGVGIAVRIEYRLAGALSFPDQICVTTAALGEKKHEFVVPILLSPPVEASSLEIRGTGGLKDVQAKAFERESRFGIECRLALDGNSEEGKTGELLVRDKKTGRETSIHCVVEAPSQVVVAPTVVRFRTEPIVAGEKVQRRSSSVLVRLHPLMVVEKEEPLMDFSSSMGKLTATVDRLALGIYRVKLDWTVENDSTEPEAEDPCIHWSVVTKKNSREGRLTIAK